MRSTLRALGRLSATGGLYLAMGLGMLLTMLGHGLSGLGLRIAEWAKAQISDLKGQGK